MPGKCIEDGCNKIPLFNVDGEKCGIYCFAHKEDSMIDVINKRCIELGCTKQPNFNFEGEKSGLYCSKHKKDNMIDVKSKHCIEPGCNTIPVFNFNGEKYGIYCSTHKKDGMIDLKSKRCIEINCNRCPIYNFKDKQKAIYCSIHKKDDMINVISRRCIENNCSKIPIFNFNDKKCGIYCSKHKKDGMIDVKKKKCKHNVNKEYCKVCEGSALCKHGRQKSRCRDCGTIVLCEHGKRKTRCKTCGGSELCNTPLCETKKRQKYDGYCFNCFIHQFPDRPNARNYKTKEKATADYVLEKFPDFTWFADKQIQDGCSKKRPDLLLDLGYQVIVAEIDENQHESYDCSCENKRLMTLSQDVGHRPMIFIRFNPDDYLKGDEKVTSCWANNKLGVCTVKKTKVKEWNERLESLIQQITYWTNPENKTEKTVEIVQLFYDCNH